MGHWVLKLGWLLRLPTLSLEPLGHQHLNKLKRLKQKSEQESNLHYSEIDKATQDR